MAIPLIIGAAIGAGAGVAKAIQGARQARQARDIERNNVRPEFDIAEEYFANRDLAARMAQSGLGAQALNFYRSGAERGLTASLGALAQAGGGPNAVADLYDTFQQGIGGIAAADAQAQAQNLRTLMAQNDALASARTMQWSLNEYEPYKDRAQLAGSLRRIGTENIYSGITQVGGAVASFGKGLTFQQDQPDNAAIQQRQAEEITNVLPNATVEPVSQPQPVVPPTSYNPFNYNIYDSILDGRMRRNYMG